MGKTNSENRLSFENNGFNSGTDAGKSGADLSGSGDTGSQVLNQSGTLGSVNASYVASDSNVSLKPLSAGSLKSSGSALDTTSRQDLVYDTSDDYMPCKWGPAKPRCCRPFNNVKVALFILCCVSAIQGMVVNGFVNVSITSVEKRFDIESKDAGLIASAYDISSVIVSIPVGYFGGNGSKPRWLGFGVLLMGIGSLVFALPHFITDVYLSELPGEDAFCDLASNRDEPCKDSIESTLWRYKYILYLGQLLHGVGAAPLYTLGVTYLDDNLKPKMSSLYLGIFYAVAIVGPALGYIIGGFCLSIYTDFYKVDVDTLSIDADSETWVGAWWIGPLVCAGLAFIISIPLLGFPKRLPGWKALQQFKESEAYGGMEDCSPSATGLKSLKDFPKAVKTLFTNPTFMFLNLAGAAEGAISVPTGGGGMFLGGYLVKRFKLKVRGILKLVLILNVIILLLAVAYVIRCPNVDFAGVNVDYNGGEMTRKSSDKTLKGSCNSDCDCSYINFAPVCGDNDVMYFNPCAAGCLETNNKETKFDNCTCVMSASEVKYSKAKSGKCASECSLLPVFLTLQAILIFLTFTTDIPALTATIRCVPEKQRSFAISIQWIIVRCLGTIPGPIIFGAIIDETCLFWKSSCDNDTGACYFYDNNNLSNYFIALCLTCKVLSTIFFSLSAVLYKAPPKQDTPQPVTAAVSDKSVSADKSSSIANSSSNSAAAQSEVGAGDIGMTGYDNPVSTEN